MSGVVKSIGKVVKKVGRSVSKFVSKYGKHIVLGAALWAGGAALAGGALAGGAAGTAATAAGGIGAAGSTGMLGAGSFLGEAGLAGMGAATAGGAGTIAAGAGASALGSSASGFLGSSMAKQAAALTVEGAKSGLSISQTGKSVMEKVQGFGEKIKTGFEKFADWTEEHPLITKFGGEVLSNYAKASAAADAAGGKEWHGTYFGATPGGKVYDPGKKEMVDYEFRRPTMSPATTNSKSSLSTVSNEPSGLLQSPPSNPMSNRSRVPGAPRIPKIGSANDGAIGMIQPTGGLLA